MSYAKKSLILVSLLLSGVFNSAMAQDTLLGEIKWVPYNFAPSGWSFCNGQILDIASNSSLFSLLGNNYGGDGRINFGLPDLRGRVQISSGQGPGLSNYSLGSMGGAETVTLSANNMPAHTHSLNATVSAAGSTDPTGRSLAAKERTNLYSDDAAATAMKSGSIGNTGDSQAHENRPPYTTLNCIIATQGTFPSRS